ncbi:MAG TPA: tetraacyldisaccharide 4'-kinase, partial [Nevskiaceae bacterium]|nr:tetraacyldisaccharide 4'-kinase [Nevskiaceae bacterium]
MSLRRWLEQQWQAQHAPAALRPLSLVYGGVSATRRALLSARTPKLPLPVVVVGNISVGGTGKTPFTVWLVERLRAWGWKPGIVSRGYGGHAPHYPLRVRRETPPEHSGDEPAMLVRRLGCPLYVAPDRVAAARALIGSGEANIIVADDGLQHYRLPRDLEICIVDGQRRFGNGALLPAGPLREPPRRLAEVNLVVINGSDWACPAPARVRMDLAAREPQPLAGGAPRPWAQFAATRVHAIAGIGNPARFFDTLRAHGLDPIEHAFPDHHEFVTGDLNFGDRLPVL